MDKKHTDHPAVVKAREDLERAYAVTPEKYHHFISEIANRVRVGGTRENPQQVWVKNPYMTVDGRLMMFTDDMRARGLRYSIDTDLVQVGEHPAIKASVFIYFEQGPVCVSGLSSINFGGSGVDRTNPIENADTSALGRALGKLGYGLFGYGIASADEVEDAKTRQARPEDTPDVSAPKPPTQKQQAFLRELLEQMDNSDVEIETRVKALQSRDEASRLITELQEVLRAHQAQTDWEKTKEISATTKLLALVNERSLHSYTQGVKLQELDAERAEALCSLLEYAHDHNMLGRLEGMNIAQLTVATMREIKESMRADAAEAQAVADAQDGRDEWVDRFAEADAQMGLGVEDRRVPDMTRRPA